jgi:hypothetical protein
MQIWLAYCMYPQLKMKSCYQITTLTCWWGKIQASLLKQCASRKNEDIRKMAWNLHLICPENLHTFVVFSRPSVPFCHAVLSDHQWFQYICTNFFYEKVSELIVYILYGHAETIGQTFCFLAEISALIY